MADNLSLPYIRLGRVLTIDGLPDDVLLAIFDFYVFKYQDLDFPQLIKSGMKRKIESWQSLVHVCRRWRGLVFRSPRRLNLQICCYTPRISARKTLDVWPAFPILVLGGVSGDSVDDAIAELEYSDHISQINLVCHTTSRRDDPSSWGSSIWIKNLWKAMQVPFPELTALNLSFKGDSYGPVLPDSFLGGSAPRLRFFALDTIPFPGLTKLLLSATHLVNLHLHNIPPSKYISPEAMATCLSTLTSLETFQLDFASSQSFPGLNNQRPFPQTRSVLPTLTIFSFKGVNEYLEEFVARIDAPQLYRLSTAFFYNIDLTAPELNQFITRMRTLGAYDEARLIFLKNEVLVRLRQSHLEPSSHRMVEVKILWWESDRQLSSLAQICTLSLHPLLTMENLYIDGMLSSPLAGDTRNTRWIDLLFPFTSVKNLYLSQLFLPPIALALKDLTGGRTTEVLPALQNIFLEGLQPSKPVHKGIAQFISARRLTNHPVAISVWHRDFLWD